jgi:hypothetical protein
LLNELSGRIYTARTDFWTEVKIKPHPPTGGSPAVIDNPVRHNYDFAAFTSVDRFLLTTELAHISAKRMFCSQI